jgi:Lipocalin-like domain
MPRHLFCACTVTLALLATSCAVAPAPPSAEHEPASQDRPDDTAPVAIDNGGPTTDTQPPVTELGEQSQPPGTDPNDPASWPRDQQIVGSWLNEDNFWSGTFSSTTSRTVTLNADGSFQSKTVTYSELDGGVSNTAPIDETGHWSAQNGVLRLVYPDSTYEEYGYYVELSAGDLVMLLSYEDGTQDIWTYM